ncbi:WxL domain-containing protein [Actinomadura citrea]|uniref:WxL domain-containing protein n=1 Tax=Actinomadura citrea TaxID=46158 RepID=UPI003CE59165
MRRTRTTLRGAAAVITAAGAVTVPAAAAGTAHAATGQVPYQCTIFSTVFDYDATVTVTAPASASAGDTVTVRADFSDLPGVAPLPIESWTTSGTLTVSGAQSGSVPVSAPKRTGPIPAHGAVPIGEVTGKLTLSGGGEVRLAPGGLTIVADAGAQATISCTPKQTPASLATISVGEGGPAASVSPSSVVQGGAVSVTGSGWRPGAADIALCDANGAACKADDLAGVTASVNAAGELTASATVAESASVGARAIVVGQGTVRRAVPLTVTAKSQPSTGQCAGRAADECGEQKINLTVDGGPLTMSREPGEVDLTPVTLDGTEQTATGSLRRVEVIDARGGTAGWSLTGTLTDFTSSGGTRIPAGNLTWTPACTAAPGSSAVTPGSAGPLDTTTAATLCNAPDGSGRIVGGTFGADAGVSLKVPATTGAGRYTAVLTLTLS